MCQLFRYVRLLSDVYVCVCIYLYYCTSFVMNKIINSMYFGVHTCAVLRVDALR